MYSKGLEVFELKQVGALGWGVVATGNQVVAMHWQVGNLFLYCKSLDYVPAGTL